MCPLMSSSVVLTLRIPSGLRPLARCVCRGVRCVAIFPVRVIRKRLGPILLHASNFDFTLPPATLYSSPAVCLHWHLKASLHSQTRYIPHGCAARTRREAQHGGIMCLVDRVRVRVKASKGKHLIFSAAVCTIWCSRGLNGVTDLIVDTQYPKLRIS
ncbi:unnamed protein product, partial [Pylaiella littoralis]